MQQNELKNSSERHFERKVAKSFAEGKKYYFFFKMKYRSGYCIQFIWEMLPIVGNGFPLLERIFNMIVALL